jgi:hypothetical protein
VLTVGVVVSVVSVAAVLEVEVIAVVVVLALVVVVTEVLDADVDVDVDVEPPGIVDALTTAIRAGTTATPNANSSALATPTTSLRTTIRSEVSSTRRPASPAQCS